VNQTFNSTKGSRRKSAVATVELVRGTGKFTINTIPGIDYMQQKADLLLLFKPH
jgi:ribosomal protein S9